MLEDEAMQTVVAVMYEVPVQDNKVTTIEHTV